MHPSDQGNLSNNSPRSACSYSPFLDLQHPTTKGRNFDHIKFVMSGAAPLGSDLMTQMSILFPNACIGQGYGTCLRNSPGNIETYLLGFSGLTETATTICMMQPGQKMATMGSAGELIPGIVARVVKPDGSLAAEGELGELVVTGPSMAMGYYGNPAAFVKSLYMSNLVTNTTLHIAERLKPLLMDGYELGMKSSSKTLKCLSSIE